MNEEENEIGLKYTADMINERREVAHVREFSAEQTAAKRYNSKVKPREMHNGELVLK